MTYKIKVEIKNDDWLSDKPDWIGNIYTLRRGGDKSEHAAFYEAGGYDAYGSPDHDRVIELAVKDPEALKILRFLWVESFDINAESEDEATEMVEIFDAWVARGFYSNYGQQDPEDFNEFESCLDEAFETLQEIGKIGNPYRVYLDCYQHSRVVWSVTGTGVLCMFDTARKCGVWVPNDDQIEDIKIRCERGETQDDVIVSMCKDDLRDYNAWLNGEIYGVVVTKEYDTGGIEELDAVWGFYGYESAEIQAEEFRNHYASVAN